MPKCLYYPDTQLNSFNFGSISGLYPFYSLLGQGEKRNGLYESYILTYEGYQSTSGNYLTSNRHSRVLQWDSALCGWGGENCFVRPSCPKYFDTRNDGILSADELAAFRNPNYGYPRPSSGRFTFTVKPWNGFIGGVNDPNKKRLVSNKIVGGMTVHYRMPDETIRREVLYAPTTAYDRGYKGTDTPIPNGPNYPTTQAIPNGASNHMPYDTDKTWIYPNNLVFFNNAALLAGSTYYYHGDFVGGDPGIEYSEYDGGPGDLEIFSASKRVSISGHRGFISRWLGGSSDNLSHEQISVGGSWSVPHRFPEMGYRALYEYTNGSFLALSEGTKIDGGPDYDVLAWAYLNPMSCNIRLRIIPHEGSNIKFGSTWVGALTGAHGGDFISYSDNYEMYYGFGPSYIYRERILPENIRFSDGPSSYNEIRDIYNPLTKVYDHINLRVTVS